MQTIQSPRAGRGAGGQTADERVLTPWSADGSGASPQVAVIHQVRPWLEAIAQISVAVNETAPLTDVLDTIASTICRLLGYDFGAVLLVDDAHERLLIRGSFGLSASYVASINSEKPIRVGHGLYGEGPSSRAFRSRRPITVRDYQTDETVGAWAGVAVEQGFRSLISVPLIVSGQAIGTFNCYTRAIHVFSDDEIISCSRRSPTRRPLRSRLPASANTSERPSRASRRRVAPSSSRQPSSSGPRNHTQLTNAVRRGRPPGHRVRDVVDPRRRCRHRRPPRPGPRRGRTGRDIPAPPISGDGSRGHRARTTHRGCPRAPATGPPDAKSLARGAAGPRLSRTGLDRQRAGRSAVGHRRPGAAQRSRAAGARARRDGRGPGAPEAARRDRGREPPARRAPSRPPRRTLDPRSRRCASAHARSGTTSRRATWPSSSRSTRPPPPSRAPRRRRRAACINCARS